MQFPFTFSVETWKSCIAARSFTPFFSWGRMWIWGCIIVQWETVLTTESAESKLGGAAVEADSDGIYKQITAGKAAPTNQTQATAVQVRLSNVN